MFMESSRRQKETKKGVEDDMRDANGVGFDPLFKEFFRKVMKAPALSETVFNTVYDKVQAIIKAISQDPRAPGALKQYKTSGNRESSAYEPLTKLFNTILDVIREPEFQSKLDEHLRSEDTDKRIKFIRHENRHLAYDWPASPPTYVPLKPDILIVFEKAIGVFENNQVKGGLKKAKKDHGRLASKQAEEYSDHEPHTEPQSGGARIAFKDVLSCIELKWDTSRAKQSGHLGVDTATQSSDQQDSEELKSA
ncbi:hypothetical protein P691DRAFT_569761 [Macrolepiota fuliginosa MF-IS2]|uniref:Uncharacterized protein n=1 Tax=Macrolepiota fuliginosa MF-IS2 TaxID=1400762 RepID=A0A9P5X0V2_9AGAR|nr:hypothetical protein P691DRAFT_569761 [Macrolepiota fuliginosa MF-IS2]